LRAALRQTSRMEVVPTRDHLGGALVLVGYGVIPTLQTDPHFGRVYAAHGGVFVALSLLWGRVCYGVEADRWDLLGALICLVEVLVIFFGPRGAR
jgi:small multidrug resistance family-3 protein